MVLVLCDSEFSLSRSSGREEVMTRFGCKSETGSSCNVVLLASYSLHLFDRVHQCRHFSGSRDPTRIVWRKTVLGSAGCINCWALCSGQTFPQWDYPGKRLQPLKNNIGFYLFLNMGNRVTHASHPYPVLLISRRSLKRIVAACQASCLRLLLGADLKEVLLDGSRVQPPG